MHFEFVKHVYVIFFLKKVNKLLTSRPVIHDTRQFKHSLAEGEVPRRIKLQRTLSALHIAEGVPRPLGQEVKDLPFLIGLTSTANDPTGSSRCWCQLNSNGNNTISNLNRLLNLPL